MPITFTIDDKKYENQSIGVVLVDDGDGFRMTIIAPTESERTRLVERTMSIEEVSIDYAKGSTFTNITPNANAMETLMALYPEVDIRWETKIKNLKDIGQLEGQIIDFSELTIETIHENEEKVKTGATFELDPEKLVFWNASPESSFVIKVTKVDPKKKILEASFEGKNMTDEEHEDLHVQGTVSGKVSLEKSY